MAKEALVVDRKVLFQDKEFEGFLPKEAYDYDKIILRNFRYHPRGDDLESNDLLQQIIPYVWIINPKTKEIFAYRRAATKAYDEKKLRNKWSCGVGGHIDREDVEDPIQNAMMRELQEEVHIEEYPEPKAIGYLNLNHDVHAVHFGIVLIAETVHPVSPKDPEIAEGRFFSISELEKLFNNSKNDIEEWTRISWPFIKDYLKSL